MKIRGNLDKVRVRIGIKKTNWEVSLFFFVSFSYQSLHLHFCFSLLLTNILFNHRQIQQQLQPYFRNLRINREETHSREEEENKLKKKFCGACRNIILEILGVGESLPKRMGVRLNFSERGFHSGRNL